MSQGRRQGFTLIELSIVLVIIGLLVGGVLVGTDLVRAAGERAQISQIEKYNQAVNTFRGKYGQLPGDMDATTAAQFGFTPRGIYEGTGDGNGIIEGIDAIATGDSNPCFENGGETVTFWVDLTTANGLNLNLIDGSFSQALPNNLFDTSAVSGTSLNRYFPVAKIGTGNYVYVYSSNGLNFYGLSVITSVQSGIILPSTVGLSVRQAHDIDKKMDDGL